MNIQIVAFRYFKLDDINSIRIKLAEVPKDKARDLQSIEELFIKIAEQSDTHQPESINPDTESKKTELNLINILREDITFEEIQDITFYYVKVGTNPFGFERVFIFECTLKEETDESRSRFEDRIKLGMLDLDKIDVFFSGAMSEVKPNLITVIGETGLQENGLYEGTTPGSVRKNKVYLEKYYTEDARFIMYCNDNFVDDLEFSDLLFLFLIPFKKEELEKSVDKLEQKRIQWQSEVRSLITDFLKKDTDATKGKEAISNMLKKLNEYFDNEKEIDQISQKAKTLETRINSTKQAPEGQIHRIISEDIESTFKTTIETINSTHNKWRDNYDSLRETAMLSIQSTQLDILDSSTKTTNAIRRILSSSSILSILVASFGFFMGAQQLEVSIVYSLIIGVIAGFAAWLISNKFS